jgi:hypothetical protein
MTILGFWGAVHKNGASRGGYCEVQFKRDPKWPKKGQKWLNLGFKRGLKTPIRSQKGPMTPKRVKKDPKRGPRPQKGSKSPQGAKDAPRGQLGPEGPTSAPKGQTTCPRQEPAAKQAKAC